MTLIVRLNEKDDKIGENKCVVLHYIANIGTNEIDDEYSNMEVRIDFLQLYLVGKGIIAP